MTAENEYKYIIIPLYETVESGTRGPDRATGHALVRREKGNPPAITLYYPEEIHSGEAEIAIFAPWEDTGVGLHLNPAPGQAKGLKRYTGFLAGIPGELNNKPTGQWKLKVCVREGETLLEGKFNFPDVFGNLKWNFQESCVPLALPVQPVQPFANPLPNHLWWSIEA